MNRTVANLMYFLTGFLSSTLLQQLISMFSRNIFPEKFAQQAVEQVKDSNVYEIELAGYNNIRDAKDFVALYSGLPDIRIVKQTSSGRKYYYVRIGRYSKWIEAKRYLDLLLEESPELNGIVIKCQTMNKGSNGKVK